MMLTLITNNGFQVSATNGLNLLKIHLNFSVLFIFGSLTAYSRLLKETEDIRKPKYTNRATIFSSQQCFKS